MLGILMIALRTTALDMISSLSINRNVKHWKALASRSWESHEIVELTQKHHRTRKFKRNRLCWVFVGPTAEVYTKVEGNLSNYA